MISSRAVASVLFCGAALTLLTSCSRPATAPRVVPPAARGPCPAPFASNGQRAALDLAGMWEARSVPIALAWPPPADGWKPHLVPHQENQLITSDAIGPYFPRTFEQVIDAQGHPAEPLKQAAWFRRTFTLSGGVPAGMRALLRLDGVAWKHVAVLNDARVGESVLGLAPHVHDITSALRAGDNTIAIGATGRAALWDQERKSYVAPFAGVMPGIYDQVRIELVPALRIDDAFVRTSVATGRIEIDLTLVNAGDATRMVGPQVTVIDPDGGVPLSIDGAPVTVGAGETVTVTVGADWLAAHLWTTGTPNIHRAEIRLREGSSEIDHLTSEFGYREFSAKGRDFLLNGRRQVLLRNSWLTTGGAERDKVIGNLRDAAVQNNCIRLHLAQNNPYIIEQADHTGMMIIPEFWGWYSNNDKPFPITRSEVWLPNTIETMRRQVRRWRNHPSVIMWSVTNETMWDSTTSARMAAADLVCKALRAADPTRLLQGDAEITWGGRLDAINIHYPEGDAGAVGRKYPNSGWVMPNDLAWLSKDGPNHSWRADFTWDRPLMLGEYYAPDGDEPERYTPYAGDVAFDRVQWQWKNYYGRDALDTRGSPWIDMVRMSSDHYRAAGVACLNPWTGQGFQTLPPLHVAPLDHFPNAFGGEDYPRRFVVFNDHHQEHNDLHVQAALTVDGRVVWSEQRIPTHCKPGESLQFVLPIRTPRVAAQVKGRLVVRLCWMRGPTPYEFSRHEEDVWIGPRQDLSGIDPNLVALVDIDGTTATALAGMGLKLEAGRLDDASLAGRRLLVIGEGAAAAKPDLAAAARFAEQGGRVLVLHQDALDAFIPAQPEIDARHAASFSWRKAEHPALAGLEDGQLRFWHPDHLVSTATMIRPSAGAGEPVAACGGLYGMHWSPLVEVRHGRGSVTFCQYLLAGRTAVEPAAARILAQAVRAGVATEPAAPAPPLRLIGGNKAVRVVLKASHVRTSEGPDGDGPALVDATQPPSPEVLQRLLAEVQAGRTLWLRGLDETTLPAVQALLPWQPTFAPLPPKTVGAVLRGTHPLTSGLGSSDLYWARGPDGGKATLPLGGPVVSPPLLDQAVLLTEPALLLAVPVGTGWVLIDQFAWDKGLAIETERVTRLAACLARNAGAGFASPAESARRYRFTGLDLSRHANRSYVDDKAGDGIGGFTDQGDNDLRYFLINHTGMVGGMAVAGEPFPDSVKLQGVEFRLTDPGRNQGKALITLRAGDIDAAAPSEVRGIPAGGARADRVWFLHTGAWPTAGHGTTIARYEVVYTDGSRAAIPVRTGLEINDWWDPRSLAGATVAWTGRNEKKAPIGIYSMSWDNPDADKPIASIDIIGSLAQTQLVVLAISLGAEEAAAKPNP